MSSGTTLLRVNPSLLRMFAAGVVALFLQLPVKQIANLVRERQTRQEVAVTEVTDKAGHAQILSGPAIIVPFTRTLLAATPDAAEYELTLMPKRLEVTGQVNTENRRRGIFSIPVYSVDLELSGRFTTDDLAGIGVDADTIDWSRARFVMGISEVRTLQGLTQLTWAGKPVEFLPGAMSDPGAPGIHAPLAINGLGQGVDFSFPLKLSGSQRLFFTPNGRETTVAITGNSGFASFQGKWLPVEREVTDNGFTARWTIPYLARSYPQGWFTAAGGRDERYAAAMQGAQFGVEILSPVDAYRMAERSVKYAMLFVVLTFALIWLLDVVAGRRVHPIQYLLLGSALCLFYLLMLSLAEHLTFGWAYLLASAAIVGLCTAYSASTLGRWSRAGLMGLALSGLYAYLYILLTNEDHALLVGSLGLLIALAIIMFATRRVDWFAAGAGGHEDALAPLDPT